MSKRKASDAASSPLDAAAALATAAAAAAEETSPSKRMKAASDPADAPQVFGASCHSLELSFPELDSMTQDNIRDQNNIGLVL